MSPTQIVVLVLVVIAVVVLAGAAYLYSRRRSLRNKFGVEYDRVVSEAGSRPAAEKELRERERRHAELELRPLSATDRAQYAAAWEEVQAKFIDSPGEAVGQADVLVTRLIAERGYPTENYEDQLAHLSVEHAQTLGHYRDAHEISARNEKGEASTEQLRQALVHYRALFADLLGQEPVPTSSDSVASTTAPPQSDPAVSTTARPQSDSADSTTAPPQRAADDSDPTRTTTDDRR